MKNIIFFYSFVDYLGFQKSFIGIHLQIRFTSSWFLIKSNSFFVIPFSSYNLSISIVFCVQVVLISRAKLRSHFDDFFPFRVGSYEEADETDTYGTFNNGTNGTTVTNVRPVLRTQSTIDETSQGTYEGFKGSLKGLKLYWSQFLGLIVKRLIYTKRRYLLYGILVS